MKIVGTIEKYVRCVLTAKLCQQTFMKKRPGHLDTPHLIFKSHKTMCSEQRSFQQFLLFSLFATSHEGKNNSQKIKLYAWTHRVMRLMHNGATSRTCTVRMTATVANRVNVSAIQITGLNRIGHICPVSGTLLAV